MSRRVLDAYYTQEPILDALVECYDIHGVIYDPAVGTGAVSSFFERRGHLVLTNDLDLDCRAQTHIDATTADAWHGKVFDWAITNPPFSSAMPMLEHAYQAARCGVIFLLRLSFLEPTRRRRDFLAAHPPTEIIVLPRRSFTGDGKTDSVTAMWAIWDKTKTNQKITIYRAFT